MTDEQIIQALWSCEQSVCYKCPLDEVYETEGIECLSILCKQALDLINRQKAEIERLEGELIEERTRRKNAVNSYHEAKAAAIEEFVNRFEKNIKDVQFTLGQTWEIQNALKQIKKEMTQPTKIEHNSLCETETYKE